MLFSELRKVAILLTRAQLLLRWPHDAAFKSSVHILRRGPLVIISCCFSVISASSPQMIYNGNLHCLGYICVADSMGLTSTSVS